MTATAFISQDATIDLQQRAREERVRADAEALRRSAERATQASEAMLCDARRDFKSEFDVDIDDPSVMHYFDRLGRLRVTIDGLLIGYTDRIEYATQFTLIRECRRSDCQHASDPIYTQFGSLYQLGEALEKEPVHGQDCTVEWDEEGDPIRPAKPRAQRDIVAEIAEDLGVIPGQAPEWFLQYQMRVSHHVAKLHTRINEVAAAKE